ncbi:chorismate mutase [Corynebacterium sp. sy017]|uniref:chorismate mutase n=1 Tax=unclassified Corynebacterium TaxID=2624378 RepID=UPI0011867CE3|nr:MULTISPECIES: chorismate mutase [unclassified Corynebacterium]MBP3088833.1 chorismate mutase [Corynebacterium sp. sy017]QDZ42225.1 chorismate mutase [Corynebacterium sp. sy039]TSD91176.1 chorismate mutase [Corynebacterium sp. SY003]
MSTADSSSEKLMPTGVDDALSDAEIQKYRLEIDRLDREILSAVKRRAEISQLIGKTRLGSGGTKLVHTREVAIINQFRAEIGEEGPALAQLLLRMGRGKLG